MLKSQLTNKKQFKANYVIKLDTIIVGQGAYEYSWCSGDN